MPMYDYRCEACGEIHEAQSPISHRDRDDVVCPACGASGSKRQVSAAAVTGGSSAASGPTCPMRPSMPMSPT